MSLDVLLQVLWSFESLATEFALVRLQGHMDTNMRGDMVSLHCGRSAVTPLTGEIEIICALATDMSFTNVVL